MSSAFIDEWEYEKREFEKLEKLRAEKETKEQQAAKDEAEHRAVMRRIADSLDAILTLLKEQAHHG